MIFNKTTKFIMLLVGTVAMCCSVIVMQAQTQNDKVPEDNMRTWEDVNKRVYETYFLYPKFKYSVNYDENGEIESILIKGIDNKEYQQSLSASLMQLELLRGTIVNQPLPSGYYLITETEAVPKEGMKKFYDKIYNQVEYPEEAKEAELEGTVFVKFIVEPDGTVDHITTSSNFSSKHFAVEDMEEQAMEAVKSTSGDWIPAKVGSVAVATWRMLPVRYDLKQPRIFPNL